MDLRYGTNSDGTLVKKYGKHATLKYDDTEKAVVATFTGVPALVGSEGHPEGLLVNGTAPVLEFMYYVISSGTLTAYHFTETNPFTAGTKYNIKIPSAEVLQTKDLDQNLTPTDDKPLKINEVKLRQFKNQTITRRSRAAAPVIETGISYGKLNHLNWQGAVSNPDVVRGELSIPANDGGTGVTNGSLISRVLGTDIKFNVAAVVKQNILTSLSRNMDKDVSLGNGRWETAVCDGTTFWVFNRSSDSGTAFAYNASTRQRDSSKDFTNLVEYGNDMEAAVSDGTTVWFVVDTGTTARAKAYNARTRRRDSSKDIFFDSDDNLVDGAVSDGTTLWFLIDVGSINIAKAYNARTQRREILKDIWFSDDNVYAAASDGTTLWFVENDGTVARAYNARTRNRDSSKDISIGSGDWEEAFSDGTTLWFVNDSNDTAVAYNISVSSPNVPGFGRNLTLAISAAKGSYANVDALESDFKAKVNELNFNSSSEGPANLTVSGDLTTVNKLSKTTNYYLVYNLDAKYTSSSLLKTIVDSGNFSIEFVSPSGTTTLSDGRFLAPVILSASFNSDEDDNLTADDIKDNLLLVSSSNQNQTNQFVLNEFSKSKGPTSGRNYYYRKTSSNPLDINSSVVNFVEPPKSLVFRYVLVTLRPTAEQELTAHVYQYVCRFKWLDENGLEFRSPISPKIVLFTNTPIGTPGNQPTFDVSFLNLTNKKNGVTIEIYRTRDKRGTFLFLKEVSNDVDRENAIITDDVEDKDLGQVLDPNKYVVSGAEHILTYRNRFVLYGFPDFRNRFRVSSRLRPFTNQGVAFLQSGLPGDSIEVRMASDIISIEQLDQSLIIFTEDGVYAWGVEENSLRQKEPLKISSLTNIKPVNGISVSEVSEGVFIVTPFRGIWSLTRSQGVNFVGEAIQNFKGKLRDRCIRLEDTDELRFPSTDQRDYPLCIYDYRHNEWFVDNIRDVISHTVWKGKYHLLKERGTILSEQEEIPDKIKNEVVVETSWLNFGVIQGLQRIREVKLLADIEDLVRIQLDIFIDFRDELVEQKSFTPGPPASQEVYDKAKKTYRFQFKNQQVRAMKLRWTIKAKKLDF